MTVNAKIIPLARHLLRLGYVTFTAAAMTACVSMPPNDDQPESYALTDTDDTVFGVGVTEAVAENNGKTGVLLLNTGLEAFVARAVLAATAERSLDVQYYLFHRDLSGRLLLELLLKAADRGVRVRLLVDDMDMADTDVGLAILDAHPNMEVRLFNPFARNRSRLGQYISRFGSVTRRMHNKSFTADNQMTIIGGRNIGDEYFEADPSLAFADVDALFGGPPVKEVSKSFDLYWNNSLSYTVKSLGEPEPSEEEVTQARANLSSWFAEQEDTPYMQALRGTALIDNIRQRNVDYRWAEIEIFYDQPDKISSSRDEKQLHMGQYLAPYFKEAQEEVVIISPYFVPGKGGTQALCDLEARGVRTVVLTNSLASTDVSVVHAGYLRYRKKLLKCGVEIFEANSALIDRVGKADEYLDVGEKEKNKLGMSRSSLHAKMFVFDRRYTFIGSLNLDPRSVVENTEIGSIIDSVEIGEDLAEGIIRKLPYFAYQVTLDEDGKIRWDGYEDGEPVRFTKEPHTGFFKRMGVQFMRILPIESQI